MTPDDSIVDFVREWSEETELPAERFVGWIGIARGKFFDWRNRYGKANEQSARRYQNLRVGRAQAIAADEVFAKLAARGRR